MWASGQGKVIYTMLALLLACQLMFWSHTKHMMPDAGIVPDAPSQEALHAMSFGDGQLYFRWLALNVQNMGDTYGRFTPLRLYDFSKLTLWFERLDGLDSRSNMVPALASYYF